MNMLDWKLSLIGAGRTCAMPVMTYPGLALTGHRVIDVVKSGRNQAAVITALAARYPAAAAAVAFMDLSVEAEAFGASIVFADDEIPTVTGRLVEDAAAAAALAVPAVGAGRTGEYLDGLASVVGAVNDRPVFGSCIGPFSLAGRLLDVNEALIMTHTDPDLLHAVLEKCTAFLLACATAVRAAGADGIVMAEPLAGLLSPKACDTFSSPYIRRVVEAVRGDTFAFVLHNCGNTRRLVASMVSTGADALHFGNAINLADNIVQAPPDMPVCGNLDPTAVLRMGTPEEVEAATLALLEAMRPWPNFVLSSGCDIPPGTPLANLDRFFAALARFNGEGGAHGKA